MRSGLSVAVGLTAVSVWAGFCATAGAMPASLIGAASGEAQSATAGEDRAEAIACLTQAVYYEAATEPLAGRESVAQVVLNRLRSPSFPKTVCGVVYQGAGGGSGCQFTFVCDGSMRRRPEPRLWSEAQAIAESVLDGRVPSVVGDATHYHAFYVSPPWRASMIQTARIGAHLFYRRPDGTSRRLATESEPQLALPPRPASSTFSPWGLQVATVAPSGAVVPARSQVPGPVTSDAEGGHGLGD